MVQLFVFGRWASHGQRFMNILKSFSSCKNNKVLDTTWKTEKVYLMWRREVSNLFSRLRTGRQNLCQPNQIHHNSLQMNQNCRKGGQKRERKRTSEREKQRWRAQKKVRSRRKKVRGERCRALSPDSMQRTCFRRLKGNMFSYKFSEWQGNH